MEEESTHKIACKSGRDSSKRLLIYAQKTTLGVLLLVLKKPVFQLHVGIVALFQKCRDSLLAGRTCFGVKSLELLSPARITGTW